jgi:hypothetical protein
MFHSFMGGEFSHRLNTDETQILKKIFSREGREVREEKLFSSSPPSRSSRDTSVCEIEIRAAHEIMAARTTQLALLVDQLMPTLQTKSPVFAGNIFVRRRGAEVLMKFVGRS